MMFSKCIVFDTHAVNQQRRRYSILLKIYMHGRTYAVFLTSYSVPSNHVKEERTTQNLLINQAEGIFRPFNP